ncbi:MAG: pyrroline-5-carboxylate reductase [bacterium]|nr:pyrroline-5-carboxylate reductase [bacterium]
MQTIEYQLGVIGAGNMAEAILRGLLDKKCLQPGEIVAYDPAANRQQVLTTELNITCSPDSTVPGACPHVLLAVKPYIMKEALEQIAPVISDDTTIISIAAGITSEFIDEILGHRGRIVRVMPNTPMFVGWGVSALSAGPRATSDDMQWTQKILASSGKTVVVEESMMDAVTAVSGSGPAYFFYIIEAMTAAGVAQGLDQDVAELLAVETCTGAGQLLHHSQNSPAELRKRVTTPGGTTEAALNVMQDSGLQDILANAVQAAARRSSELGK